MSIKSKKPPIVCVCVWLFCLIAYECCTPHQIDNPIGHHPPHPKAPHFRCHAFFRFRFHCFNGVVKLAAGFLDASNMDFFVCMCMCVCLILLLTQSSKPCSTRSPSHLSHFQPEGLRVLLKMMDGILRIGASICLRYDSHANVS